MILLDALFWGRFHPLVVHLPIGFLLLAMIAELFFSKEHNKKFINFIWFMGSMSAILAVILGWQLAKEGGYEEGNLYWHRWLGLALAIMSTVIWLARPMGIMKNKWMKRSFYAASIVGLLVVGHLGGNLTHGSGYLLEHAPKFIQSAFSEVDSTVVYKSLDNPDSVQLYADLVEPVLETKCMQCHNDEVQRGGLNMATPELMMEGGDNGAILTSGNARESEIFKRVVLPYDHSKFMPLKGEPMSYDEIQLMAWWINSGASFEDRLAANTVDDDMKLVLKSLYDLDMTPRPYYEKAEVAAVSEGTIDSLQALGFGISPISPNSNLLDVKYKGELDANKLQALAAIAEQITWLDLHRTGLDDDMAESLIAMPNLTRLRIQQNPLGNIIVDKLKESQHLESLNLYATQLTDEGLSAIADIKSLKRLYIWQTQVSDEAVSQLQEQRSTLMIDNGAKLELVNL